MENSVAFIPSIREKEFIRIYTYNPNSSSYIFPYVNTESLLYEKAKLGQLRLVTKISKRLQKEYSKTIIKQILNDIKLSVSSEKLLQRLIVTFPKGLGTYVYDLDKQDFEKIISL